MKTVKSPQLNNPDNLQVVCALHCAKIVTMFNGNKRSACKHLGIAYHTLVRHLKLAKTILDFRNDFHRVRNTLEE